MGCGCSKTNGTNTAHIVPGNKQFVARLTIVGEIPEGVIDPHGYSLSTLHHKDYKTAPPNAAPHIPKNSRLVDPHGYSNVDQFQNDSLPTAVDQLVDQEENSIHELSKLINDQVGEPNWYSSLNLSLTQNITHSKILGDFKVVDPQGNLSHSGSQALLQSIDRHSVVDLQGNLSHSGSKALLQSIDRHSMVDPQGNLSHSGSQMIDLKGNLSHSGSQALLQSIDRNSVVDPQGNLSHSGTQVIDLKGYSNTDLSHSLSKFRLDSHTSSKNLIPSLSLYSSSDPQIPISKRSSQPLLSIITAEHQVATSYPQLNAMSSPNL